MPLTARSPAFVTRRAAWGCFLDGGVDACVFGAGAVAAARLGILPWWAAALVLGRHLLQWSVIAFAYFAGLPVAFTVSGKLPGLVLFCGLALALLDLPFGVAFVAVGALAGVAVFAVSAVRTLRVAVEAA